MLDLSISPSAALLTRGASIAIRKEDSTAFRSLLRPRGHQHRPSPARPHPAHTHIAQPKQSRPSSISICSASDRSRATQCSAQPRQLRHARERTAALRHQASGARTGPARRPCVHVTPHRSHPPREVTQTGPRTDARPDRSTQTVRSDHGRAMRPDRCNGGWAVRLDRRKGGRAVRLDYLKKLKRLR